MADADTTDGRESGEDTAPVPVAAPFAADHGAPPAAPGPDGGPPTIAIPTVGSGPDGRPPATASPSLRHLLAPEATMPPSALGSSPGRLPEAPPERPLDVVERPLLPEPPASRPRGLRHRAPAIRARLAVVYDTDRPHVRLGIGWALLVAGALSVPSELRRPALAVLYGLAAAMAADQTVLARQERDPWHRRWAAVIGAAAIPAASITGVAGTVVATLAFVAVALAAAAFDTDGSRTTAASAAGLVATGAGVGLAGAAVVLAERTSLSGLVTLLVLVAVYEASDYVVGSGSTRAFEGPLAGAAAIVAVSAVIAFAGLPPFHGAEVWAFTALGVVGCPLGQLAASALLPEPGAHAPALRRLDSLLLLGPAWVALLQVDALAG